jgi:hypothetical protein
MTKIAGIPDLALLLIILMPISAFGQSAGEPLALNSLPNHFLKYSQVQPITANYQRQAGILFDYADYELWQYLRKGLNYLESPKPDRPPETVPPAYPHPDGKGYGPYGLTYRAYLDVQQFYGFFKRYSWQETLNSPRLYELASQAFADRLLKNLQGYIRPESGYPEIFNLLQQSWNLGLRGFKEGRQVVSSRAKRTAEFIAHSKLILANLN